MFNLFLFKKCRKATVAVIAGILLQNFTPLWGQAGITNEGPFTVMRTGGSDPLVSLGIPLFVPLTSPAAELQFIFGFSTEELDSLGAFFDSFSITLQNNDDQSNSALLFTSDRTGTKWAPANSGGLTISPATIDRQSAIFPSFLSPDLPFDQAFAVSFSIPSEFLSETNTLFLDLFDNQNTNRSLAFVYNVHLFLPIWLQSSAAPEGPFADEDGIAIDSVNRVLSIPQFSPGRFFRLRSDIRAGLAPLRIEGNDLVIDYRFEPQILQLQSATSVTGPYTNDAAAVFDLDAQTVTVPSPTQYRFYRIASDGLVKITGQQQVGNNIVWSLEFKPQVFILQSSAQAGGPYSTETGVGPAPATRSLRIPKSGHARYFRIRSVVPYHISRIQAQAERWLIYYE